MLGDNTSFFFFISLFFVSFFGILRYYYFLQKLFYYYYIIIIFFVMKIIFIFSCSGMFRNVPECSDMFRNVPCSGFYRRPGIWLIIALLKLWTRGPSIKPGTWNIPEHSGTSRNMKKLKYFFMKK